MLEDEVAERLGDADPHFEFVTPLPSGVNHTDFSAFLFTLAGHNRLEDVNNLLTLFDRPRCTRCGNISGNRTSEPLRLNAAPKDDLSFTEFLGQVISSRLATFLKLQQSKEVALLPVFSVWQETLSRGMGKGREQTSE
jgi:hypothetical protein